MIKNDRQYEYAKKRLSEFEHDLKETEKKYASGGNKKKLLCRGYHEHISQLRSEIKEYKRIKDSPLPRVLKAKSPDDISRQLVRLRISRKLTQAELASRIGCKQADVSRMEKEDYNGYTVSGLRKVAEGLGAKIELEIIPDETSARGREKKASRA